MNGKARVRWKARAHAGEEGLLARSMLSVQCYSGFCDTGVIIISSWPARFCRVPFASVRSCLLWLL